MSDRLTALCLALLLAAPLCFRLDSELVKTGQPQAEAAALAMLSREAVERHAEGLRRDTNILAAN